MKGRNSTLIQLRNHYLIKRYYFWYDIERKRIDDVVSILSVREVFLDEDYIKRIVCENNHLLKQLRKSKPKGKALDEFEFTENRMPEFVNGNLFASFAN